MDYCLVLHCMSSICNAILLRNLCICKHIAYKNYHFHKWYWSTSVNVSVTEKNFCRFVESQIISFSLLFHTIARHNYKSPVGIGGRNSFIFIDFSNIQRFIWCFFTLCFFLYYHFRSGALEIIVLLLCAMSVTRLNVQNRCYSVLSNQQSTLCNSKTYVQFFSVYFLRFPCFKKKHGQYIVQITMSPNSSMRYHLL